METEWPIVNLNLELKETDFTPEQLEELEACLFFTTVSEEDVFFDTVDSLFRDRSLEAIVLLKKLIHQGNPIFDNHAGITGLAKVGKGAIPDIIAILLNEKKELALYMFEQIFNRDGLVNFVYINSRNLVLFRKHVMMHPEWPKVMKYLAYLKPEASEEIQQNVEELEELYNGNKD